MKHSRVSRIVKILTTLQSGEKYSPADLGSQLAELTKSLSCGNASQNVAQIIIQQLIIDQKSPEW